MRMNNIDDKNSAFELVSKEQERVFCLSSILALIEIVSCFCNAEEPLFQLLSPIIYTILNL